MATESLKITVGADVAQANKSIKLLEHQLSRLQKIASMPNLSFRQLEKLNGLINKTQTQLRGFNKINTGLDNLTRQSNRATGSLIDLSRIAQDAPYGFIGIANNINPAIEGMQRLIKESGGLKNALKSLGSSLMGAGGIGLGVSLVTSLMVIYGDQLFGTKKKTEDLKNSQKEFADSLKSAESGAISSGLALKKYADIAGDSTRPLRERNTALKEANKILGEHGEKLTLANINTDKARKSIELYTQAIIQQALATKFADRVADLIIKQKDATKDYAKQQQVLNKVIQDGKQSLENLNNTLDEGGQKQVALGQQTSLNAKLQKSAYGQLVGAADNYKTVTKDLQEVWSLFNSSTEEANRLFSELGFKTKENTNAFKEQEKQLKQLKEVYEGIADMQRKLTKIDFNQVPILKDRPSYTDDLLKSESDRVGFGRDEGIMGLPSKEQLEKWIKDAEGVQKRIQDGFEKTAQAVSGALTPAFTGMFDAILAGEAPMKSFFQGLMRGVQQLINKLIQAALQAAALSFLTGGAAGGGLSFGKAFGQILGVGGFARGGGFGIGGGNVSGIMNRNAAGIGQRGLAIQVTGQLVGQGSTLSAVIKNANTLSGIIR